MKLGAWVAVAVALFIALYYRHKTKSEDADNKNH